MIASCLRSALLILSLVGGSAPPLAAASPAPRSAVRPRITSLVLRLEDGRSYALSADELADPEGGAVFWNDWAVLNLLMPHAIHNRKTPLAPESVLRLWAAPGPGGELPPFLIQTADGPRCPLPEASAPGGRRVQVIQILVGYADGRSILVKGEDLSDRRSGVMVWNDTAVANLLMPFYLRNRSLPTRADDVLRTWTSPVAAPTASPQTLSATSSTADELPGFLVKPRCIPYYPVTE